MMSCAAIEVRALVAVPVSGWHKEGRRRVLERLVAPRLALVVLKCIGRMLAGRGERNRVAEAKIEGEVPEDENYDWFFPH
jgi:hypothetical protein